MFKRLLVIAILMLCLGTQVSAVVYVDSAAPGPVHNGTSWATAYKTIQAALDSLSTVGGNVWVRTGVYRECVVINAYVNIYGGFLGYETALDQRLVGAFPTVIDARRGGRVVNVTYGQYVTIDGFILTRGRSDKGGGVQFYNDAYYTMSNCLIADCEATVYGGGIYSAPYAQGTISNCLVMRNKCPKGGGAFIEYHSYPLVQNCIFYRNHATKGGGVYFPYHAGPELRNCDIIYNAADECGGATWSEYAAPVILNNCIIAFNTAPVGGGIYGGGTSSALVYNSTDLYGNVVGDTGGILNVMPAGRLNFSADPLFLMPENDEFHLRSDSPCTGVGAYPLETPYKIDRIGVAKLLANGTPVRFAAKIVTGVDGTIAYVQEHDRATGVAVQGLTGYQPGDILASLTGSFGVNGDGKRVFTATSSVLQNRGDYNLRPLGTTILNLGSMTGLCCRIWGQVADVMPTGFKLNDGTSDVSVHRAGTVHAGDTVVVTGVPTITGDFAASAVLVR